ncbi:hypothetical protein [Phosphitispora sp. TUW77]|uniref:hypothetical protein n=1 Tax=Phosphitispora sp. TUW77 TaxID=3152361 RepID=UPI003AB343CE
MFTLESHEYYSKNNFIEIIGMPASGKTTLLREMVLNNSEVVNVNEALPKSKIIRQIYKMKCLSLYFINFPKQSIRDSKIILASKQKKWSDFFTVITNWFLVVYLYEMYKNNQECIYVWDQGLFQAIWSINFSSTRMFDSRELIKDKVLSKKVHFIDVEENILVERAINRNIPIRLNYNDKDQIQRGREALKRTIECLTAVGYNKS